jgi:hypothetical protein
MFWNRKSGNKVVRSSRPPVDELDGFVEWLLRYGTDFDEYRQVLRGTMNNFVATYTKQVSTEMASCQDEPSLTAHIDEGCTAYATQYHKLVDTAGGVRNLPSHIFDKAFPYLVRLRLLMYVRAHKYQMALTPAMLALAGPLLDI